MIGNRFTFLPAACLGHALSWTVSCDGVVRARLDFFKSAKEWRLYGLGPLSGCLYSCEHAGHPPVNVPHAWIRREAVEQLAAWALAALPAGEAD